MLTLIEDGEIYAPEPIGVQSILIDMGKILKIGTIDRRGLDLLGVEYEVIDASDAFVIPGIIDPHSHLLGGSGEDGLSTQSPMIFLSELLHAGVTTVVGVLGVDTTMKTMAGLLARVKGLKEEGLSTKMWSGGYNVPPTTVMGSIRTDMLFIDEVVGAGEIAISDKRSLQQDAQHLAQVVLDTHVGGLLSGKAGLTHLHVGEEETRLKPLRDLLDGFHIEPSWLYPTHVTRSVKLFDEALALSRKGSFIDTDTVEGDLHKWIRRLIDRNGPLDRFTISSDSGASSPSVLFESFRRCILHHRFPLELMLPFATLNTATVLKLPGKGKLEEGADGDILVLDRDGLEIIHLLAGGKRMIDNGGIIVTERFLEESDRRIDLHGKK